MRRKKTKKKVSVPTSPSKWLNPAIRVEQVSPSEEKILSDLPFSYGETKLVLMVRDPYWAYSYWDFSREKWSWTQQKLQEDFSLKPVMRVHDLTAKRFCDILISLEARNWYLHLGKPHHRYFAELGLGDGKSRFLRIAKSNEVETPRDAPSEIADPDWKDQNFDELYRLSGGAPKGSSSPSSLFFPREA